MNHARRSMTAIFAVPLLLSLASLIGLVAALTGDGPRDWLGWAALFLPVAAVLWAARYRRC